MGVSGDISVYLFIYLFTHLSIYLPFSSSPHIRLAPHSSHPKRHRVLRVFLSLQVTMLRLLAAVVMAGVIACVSGDVSLHASPPPSASSSPPQAAKYAQTAPNAAPAPAPSPETPTHSHTYASHTAGGPSEEEGYYYYYYPVQQDKTKGLFDFKNDSDLISLIIVGVLLVGGLLVALSYYQPEDARNLQISTHDMYNLASQVYKAISKTY